jgi:hypothetical protein
MPTATSHNWLVFDKHRQMIGIITATEQERLRICALWGWLMYTPNEAPAQYRKMASVHSGIAENLPKGS